MLAQTAACKIIAFKNSPGFLRAADLCVCSDLRRQFKLLGQAYQYDKIYVSEFGFARPFEYLYQNRFDILFDEG